MKVIKNDLTFEMETWEDPGDYPSGAGSGPLPSYSYATSEGEVIVEDVENEDDLTDYLLDNVPSPFVVVSWDIVEDGKQRICTPKDVEMEDDEEWY